MPSKKIRIKGYSWNDEARIPYPNKNDFNREYEVAIERKSKGVDGYTLSAKIRKMRGGLSSQPLEPVLGDLTIHLRRIRVDLISADLLSILKLLFYNRSTDEIQGYSMEDSQKLFEPLMEALQP